MTDGYLSYATHCWGTHGDRGSHDYQYYPLDGGARKPWEVQGVGARRLL